MGDSGEGLIDAEARIQERMAELARERAAGSAKAKGDPAVVSRVESLRLARVDLQRQMSATTHPGLQAARVGALADLEKQLAEAQAVLAKA
jgi:phage-related minor tail protein